MRSTALATLLCLALVSTGGCREGSRDAAMFTSAGVTHLQQGEYDRAIRDFDRAIAVQPAYVVAWRNRGLAHKEKGDYERALADYEQAILLAPSDARIYNDRGLTHAAMGDLPAAIRDFDRAIGQKADFAVAIKNRGRAHFILGNFAQAAADLQRGLAVDSADAHGVLWLHLARGRMGQDDREDFVAHAAAIDTVQWPAPMVRYYLGTIDEKQVRAAVGPDSTADREQRCSLTFYLAELALLRGQRAEATKLFEAMRAICPRSLIESRGAAAELARLGQPD